MPGVKKSRLRKIISILTLVLLYQWFSKCRPNNTASASPKNLSEMQILGPHPDTLSQKSMSGVLQSVLTHPPSDSDAQ